MIISKKIVALAIIFLCLSTLVSCEKKNKRKHPKHPKGKPGPPKSHPKKPLPISHPKKPLPGTHPKKPLPGTRPPKPLPAGPGGHEKVFNVLNFGVKPGPNTDNALNFIKAFRAACDFNGPARLLFPKGEFYATEVVFQGPCKAPIVVEIQGTIKAGSDISSYTDDFWISFEKIVGLHVMGTGTVDGNGPNVWKYKDKGSSMFPISLKFMNNQRVLISGLTSVNPMGFHISIVNSIDVTATSMHLIAPEDSPNTDGFHISQSTKVNVFDSVVATGDDCVGVIHGSIDVVVKRIVCGPGHGLSIGSLGKYDDEKLLKNVLIENCTMANTDNGARIKTYAGSPPSVAQNITFRDIIMTNVENPIIIDQTYGKKSGSPSKVQINQAQFINIRGTTPTESGVDIQCSQAVPCKGIRLSNINLKYIGQKKQPFTSVCSNVKIAYDGPQFPLPCR